MKKSLLYRCHEWLADNVKWVQYPNVRDDRPLFKHQMPWSTRALLILFGCFTIPLTLFALFLLGVLFAALI